MQRRSKHLMAGHGELTNEATKVDFLKKRVIIKHYKPKIYFAYDLTKAQATYKQKEIPKVIGAQVTRKKAIYTYRHVIIDCKIEA